MSHESHHNWAFLLESEYNPDDITLSYYTCNSVVTGVESYRCLEWVGEVLPELDNWTVFDDPILASAFIVVEDEDDSGD